MSDLMFRFTDHNTDVSTQFDGFLDYMFSASPRESVRQHGGEVCVGILTKEDTDIVRTADFEERAAKMKQYVSMFEAAGGRLSELGCFDVVVDYDMDDPDALDLAVQVLVLTLSEWSYYTDTLVAFSIHLAQDDGRDGFEPVHLHVLWDRRRGEKVYRDNVLQWYMHEQFE